MADALSKKSQVKLGGAQLEGSSQKEMIELRKINVVITLEESGALLATLKVRLILVDRIKEAQARDLTIKKILDRVKAGESTNIKIKEDGTLYINGRLCVSTVDNLKREIIEEAHSTPYFVHLGTTKIYRILKTHD